MLELCNLCPHNCRVDRVDSLGFCQAPNELKINLAQLHFGEEPFLVGSSGSGTIFFSHCNLKCCFCQNYKISALGKGKIISGEELLKIIFSLQEQGAVNINLVSPTPYSHLLIKVIKEAKKQGLRIPIVWNTNSYESVETLKKLEGLVDIYLADFKYWNNDLAWKYSHIPNYHQVASSAIKEMVRQTGHLKIDQDGFAWMGTLVRVLILPDMVEDAKNILRWISENLTTNAFISIMSQYYPTYRSKEFPDINRPITNMEYQKVLHYADKLNLTNYLFQEGSISPEWTPDFK